MELWLQGRAGINACVILYRCGMYCVAAGAAVVRSGLSWLGDMVTVVDPLAPDFWCCLGAAEDSQCKLTAALQVF